VSVKEFGVWKAVEGAGQMNVNVAWLACGKPVCVSPTTRKSGSARNSGKMNTTLTILEEVDKKKKREGRERARRKVYR